jgi:hypothetical protein
MRDCSKGRQMGMLAVGSTNDYSELIKKIVLKN